MFLFLRGSHENLGTSGELVFHREIRQKIDG